MRFDAGTDEHPNRRQQDTYMYVRWILWLTTY